MNFIWVIIGVVYVLYRLYKDDKQQGANILTIIAIPLGCAAILVVLFNVLKSIGFACGGETGEAIGVVIYAGIIVILSIIWLIYYFLS